MLRLTLASFAILCCSSIAVAQGVGGGNAGGGGFGGGGAAGGAAGILQNGQAGEGGGTSGVLSDRGESTVGGSGFLGRDIQNGGGFMAGQGTSANGNANFGGGNFGNAGNFGGNAGGGRGGQNGQQPQQQRSTRVIRTRLTVPRDFGRVIIPSSRIQSDLNTEYRRVSVLQQRTTGAPRISTTGLRGSNVTVTANGPSVVLTGQVSSKRDRQIAEKMAKMEPGVDSVINELIVIPNQ